MPSSLHSSLSPEQWTEFLGPLVSPSLTLIGFEGLDLLKMYDALEMCAKNKNIQTVEVFIRSPNEMFELEMRIPPGLCLVKIPDPVHVHESRQVFMLLGELTDNDTLTVLPVLKPDVPNGDRLVPIKSLCPAYLNIDSNVCDFASLFSAFVFPPSASHSNNRIKPHHTESQLAFID